MGDLIGGEGRDRRGFAFLGEQQVEVILRSASHREDMGEGREVGAQFGDHGAVIEAAEPGRGDQRFALGVGQHETELTGAEDRHQWIERRAEMEGGEVEEDEFRPVGKLGGDHIAPPRAATGEGPGQAARCPVEVAIGVALAAAAFAAIGDEGLAVGGFGEARGEIIEQGPVWPEPAPPRRIGAGSKQDRIESHSFLSLNRFFRLVNSPYPGFPAASPNRERPGGRRGSGR